MEAFFPFIHQIKKKEKFEPEPLYVEVYPPPFKEKEDKEDKEESSKVIVIEL